MVVSPSVLATGATRRSRVSPWPSSSCCGRPASGSPVGSVGNPSGGSWSRCWCIVPRRPLSSNRSGLLLQGYPVAAPHHRDDNNNDGDGGGGGGEQDRAQGEGPGPGRAGQRRVGGRVLQGLGHPAGGGHIPGPGDVS